MSKTRHLLWLFCLAGADRFEVSNPISCWEECIRMTRLDCELSYWFVEWSYHHDFHLHSAFAVTVWGRFRISWNVNPRRSTMWPKSRRDIHKRIFDPRVHAYLTYIQDPLLSCSALHLNPLPLDKIYRPRERAKEENWRREWDVLEANIEVSRHAVSS